MRSRNGDRPFIRSICATIIISSLSLLNAQEYLISYRYVAKNALSYNESFYVSHAMTQCGSHSFEPLILENTDDSNLKAILLNNFDLFFDYIQKLGLHVQHREHFINHQSASFTSVTLKTTCFKVEFNDSFVIIQALK